jgi:hypothetical protein
MESLGRMPELTDYHIQPLTDHGANWYLHEAGWEIWNLIWFGEYPISAQVVETLENRIRTCVTDY